MAGGGQGTGPTQGTTAAAQDISRPGGMVMQPMQITDPAQLQAAYGAKLYSGPSGGTQTNANFAPIGYADGGMIQNGYNNFASPNQNFMAYQGQGQPNQPSSGLFGSTQPVQGYDVPDVTGSNPSNNMGFDGSGSDAGVAGQPVNQPQTPLQPPAQPLQQGNKPLGLAQFQSSQGLQIQGNPTSQVVQRPLR